MVKPKIFKQWYICSGKYCEETPTQDKRKAELCCNDCCICGGCFFAGESKTFGQHEYCPQHKKIIGQAKKIKG